MECHEQHCGQAVPEGFNASPAQRAHGGVKQGNVSRETSTPLPGEAQNRRAFSFVLNCFSQQHTLTNCHCGCVFIADCPFLFPLSPLFPPLLLPSLSQRPNVENPEAPQKPYPSIAQQPLQVAPCGVEMRVLLSKEGLSFYYFLHTLHLLWKYYQRKKLVLQRKGKYYRPQNRTNSFPNAVLASNKETKLAWA